MRKVDDRNGPAVRVAPLTGRRVRLTSISPADYGIISHLEQDYDDSVLYRHRGASVAPEALPEALWRSVLVNFAVRELDRPAPIGLMTCYGADFRSGIASIGMNIAPEFRGGGHAGEAGALFIRFLFVSFPFRKLYAQVAGWAEGASGVARIAAMREEGRLAQHEYHDGKYYDVLTYALYREDWEKSEARRQDPVARFRECAG